MEADMHDAMLKAFSTPKLLSTVINDLHDKQKISKSRGYYYISALRKEGAIKPFGEAKNAAGQTQPTYIIAKGKAATASGVPLEKIPVKFEGTDIVEISDLENEFSSPSVVTVCSTLAHYLLDVDMGEVELTAADVSALKYLSVMLNDKLKIIEQKITQIDKEFNNLGNDSSDQNINLGGNSGKTQAILRS